MRGPSLLVLSLVLISGFVSSAPIEKAPEQSKHAEVLEVAKRDQEMILFGNQQNDPRVIKKKSDPEMPAIADDNTVDKMGFIEAVPAIPIKEEQTDDSQVLEQMPVEADDIQQQTAESAEAELPPIKQAIPAENIEGNEEEESEPIEDSNSVEEELKGIMADSNSQEEAQEVEAPSAGEEVPEVPAAEPTDESESDNEVPEDSDSEEESAEAVEPKEEDKEPGETEMVPAEPAVDNSLMDFYYYMLENEKAREEPQQGDYYYDLNYFPYRRRRSSRRARAVTEGGMTHNELQRSKRIKRDLFEDDEGYYYPYGEEEEEYVPELSDEDLYELYRVEPKYEDEVATLLNMYQQAPETQAYEPYEPYTVEDVYPELYEEEMEQEQEPEEIEYVPSKRQSMGALPGIKKRYFYPFSREPQTHWGAFVPEQKRDYDQTYRRLLALASALSEESPYYQAYRRK